MQPELGSGSFGCVVAPALHCDPGTIVRNPATVGKLAFSDYDIQAIQKEYRAIKAIDPTSKFTLPLSRDVCTVAQAEAAAAKQLCKEASPEQLGPVITRMFAEQLIQQLIMPRAAGDIYHLLQKPERSLPCAFWMVAVQKLIAAMAQMGKGGYIHGDLKPLNVVICVHEQAPPTAVPNWTLALIDFGSAAPFQRVLDANDADRISEHAARTVYPYTPPECCFIPGATIVPHAIYDLILRYMQSYMPKLPASRAGSHTINADTITAYDVLQPIVNVFERLRETSTTSSLYTRSSVSMSAEAFNMFQLGVSIADIFMLTFAHPSRTKAELCAALCAVGPLAVLLEKMCAERIENRPTSVAEVSSEFNKCFICSVDPAYVAAAEQTATSAREAATEQAERTARGVQNTNLIAHRAALALRTAAATNLAASSGGNAAAVSSVLSHNAQDAVHIADDMVDAMKSLRRVANDAVRAAHNSINAERILKATRITLVMRKQFAAQCSAFIKQMIDFEAAFQLPRNFIGLAPVPRAPPPLLKPLTPKKTPVNAPLTAQADAAAQAQSHGEVLPTGALHSSSWSPRRTRSQTQLDKKRPTPSLTTDPTSTRRVKTE